MHPNPTFRRAETKQNLDLARTRSFGVLCVNGDPSPLLAHIPFVIRDAGAVIEAHLVRSNPIARLLDQPVPAVLQVSGADGYISPDWYGTDEQVPTWNYVAVHIRGVLQREPDTALRGVIDRLSAEMEARLAPKRPWKADKMTPEILQRMMRAIVPVTLHVESVDGTWKLGQNKDDAVRLSAADQVEMGVGTELDLLAALMRDPPA